MARCLGLPRLLLCSTDDPNVKGTWRHLGFHYSTEQDLKDFGVQHGDLLHMDNTVQMHKVGLRHSATHMHDAGSAEVLPPRVRWGLVKFILMLSCPAGTSNRSHMPRAGPLLPDVGRQPKHILVVTQGTGHAPVGDQRFSALRQQPTHAGTLQMVQVSVSASCLSSSWLALINAALKKLGLNSTT